MNDNQILTAGEFAAAKFDLPEAGRWVELVGGQLVTLDPPDTLHGTVVLNLSKALAEPLQGSTEGYACFELGLVVAKNPDTVRCPAISVFLSGDRFSEADKVVTNAEPALVVDVASTGARRRGIDDRIAEFQAMGVELIWVADTVDREVHIHRSGRPSETLDGSQTLHGDATTESPILAGFKVTVADLFAEPGWWCG